MTYAWDEHCIGKAAHGRIVKRCIERPAEIGNETLAYLASQLVAILNDRKE